MNKEKLKEKYDSLKEELELINHDATLKRYKILSEAYKLGKKIYGLKYSYFRLSFDFEVPYTTVKRVCSLSKANFKTWKLINSNEITSFKVAQILMQHGPTYQDELIKITIENNLSTYGIRELRCSSLQDIKKLRLKIAVNEGFARQHVAYQAFQTTIDRLLVLMTIDEDRLPIKKLPKLRKEMKYLVSKIGKFEKRISPSINNANVLEDKDGS